MKSEVLEGRLNGLPCESAPVLEEKKHEKLEEDLTDHIFARWYFVLGYVFVEVFFINAAELFFTFSEETVTAFQHGVAVFTGLYAVTVMIYLRRKGTKPPANSYFWLIVLFAEGLPFAFWSVMGGLQVMALLLTAAYWTLAASGRLLEGKTSKWIFFDLFNAVVMGPLGNAFCQWRIIAKRRKESSNTGIAVLLGLALASGLLLLILPRLFAADVGFQRLVGGWWAQIEGRMIDQGMQFVPRLIFTIPAAACLFGLIFGAVSGRYMNAVRQDRIHNFGQKLQILSGVAACTCMLVISLVYILFIGLQGRYLFSAFIGSLPEEYTYAQYARQGFFELCQIAVLNLLILAGVKIFTKGEEQKKRVVCVLVIVLSGLTLCLIFTAMSKMGMYISVYGLTVRRILTMTFMVWLAAVFTILIICQKKALPATRICVAIGAVLFALLCVIPVGELAETYNVWRGFV